SIADADFYLVEPIENIELGQRQPIDAAGPRGLTHQHGIEPAAAPGAACHGAELAAALADTAPNFVLLLGRERPLAYPRRIGLADAEHIIDRAGPQAAAGRCLPGHRVRRGDERIGPVVDVEQRALRALEQDALAL